MFDWFTGRGKSARDEAAERALEVEVERHKAESSSFVELVAGISKLLAKLEAMPVETPDPEPAEPKPEPVFDSNEYEVTVTLDHAEGLTRTRKLVGIEAVNQAVTDAFKGGVSYKVNGVTTFVGPHRVYKVTYVKVAKEDNRTYKWEPKGMIFTGPSQGYVHARIQNDATSDHRVDPSTVSDPNAVQHPESTDQGGP